MAALRRRVLAYDVERWVRCSLDALPGDARGSPRHGPATTPRPVLEALARELQAAPRLLLLLDYDGTLVPIERTPELARPDPGVCELLRALAARPGTEVHVVSGRARDVLDAWLGALPVGLHAEHGLWSRPAGGAWSCDGPTNEAWREPVLAILEHFTSRTPGSLVETKSASLAWHYRAADPEFGDFQAKDLRLHLTELLANQPVEILSGDRVIEIRPHGMHKGRIVGPLLAALPPGARVLALGDDATDEDLFAALPESAASLHVGPSPSRATHRIASVSRAREFLGMLLEVASR